MIDAALALTESTGRAYWLAVRGEQQMDLAARFAAGAEKAGLRVMALKGISIATELYGSVHQRPMADIDFLVVDTGEFARIADLARSLDLVETEASDHALVFKEKSSGVVLELHVSLTACPGLFPVKHEALWRRRVCVAGAPMWRLGNADLLVHLALHTGFQHAFSANEFHYGDFVRGLNQLAPEVEEITDAAVEAGALPVLAAMSLACATRFPESPRVASLAREIESVCPRPIATWISNWKATPPPFNMSVMAYVRFHLAPSKVGFMRRSLFPSVLPGRTLPGRRPLSRLATLASLLFSKPQVQKER